MTFNTSQYPQMGLNEVRMKNKRIAKSEVLHSYFVCSNVLTSNIVPVKNSDNYKDRGNIKERGFLKSLYLAPCPLKGVLYISDNQQVPFRGFRGNTKGEGF